MPGYETEELTPAEIDAIVALLQDQNERTDAMIVAQLLKRPAPSRQAVLDRAEAAGVWVALRLGRVLRLNHREDLGLRFATLPRDEHGEIDLETGVLLVARVGLPDVDEAAVRRQLDAWAHDVHMAIAPEGGRQAELNALLQVLFKRLGFRGEEDSYFDPQNSLVPRVMETRMGLPITLSVVALLVARRLGLPLHGVGAPGHFLLRYDVAGDQVYIDAFDGGTLLTARDCYDLLRRHGYRPGPESLPIVGPTAIVARMLNNLGAAYNRLGDEESAADCQVCLEGLGVTSSLRDDGLSAL